MSGIWVVMTDKFMSGWGGAAGKTSRFAVECSNFDQAVEILAASRRHPEMTRAAIVRRMPKNTAKVHVSIKAYSEISKSWKGA